MQEAGEDRKVEDVADSKSALGRGNIGENCVEYYLFIIDHQTDHVTHMKSLEALRKFVVELCQKLTRSYIWQRDEFSVELKISHGLMFLYGITDYGEAIEDEWLIVYMLRELTKSFPRLWVRVADTDGEFLLIEAANTLPEWINPGIDENRVWLHDTKLYIIPMQIDHDRKHEETDKISLYQAVNYLRQKPNALLHHPSTEHEAFYRLQKYPDFVTASTHYSVVIVPRKLAYILHRVPKSIAMATEMFYLRDAIALQDITSGSSTLVFPLDDPVSISVQFSKLLYAQLKSQRVDPPPEWRRLISTRSQDPSFASSQAPSQLDLGMKITLGYELLSRVANTSRRRVVRELDILLQDLLEDGYSTLPTNSDIEGWPHNRRNDDDRWLDIDFSEFERQLEGRHARCPEKAPSRLNDANSTIDLQKIVSRVGQFLYDEKADVDGAVFDEMEEDNDDGEDDDDDGNFAEYVEGTSTENETVRLDEEVFAQLMKEMMKPPHGVAASADKDGISALNDASLEVAKEDATESNETKHLMAQFEAELKQYGALDFNVSDNLQAPELKQAQIREGYSQPGTDSTSATDNDLVNIDYHLAENILKSFKSQAGMAGPASNLLAMMGLKLPRDEED
ncbi:hypothetical protein E4U42_002419 [Claviceps africana]|uniref:Uncharacterized protein n=1 Tax=Claviceps africana TaxID=83212 RepID=A0A8K0J877_9HYPO|nr:hypothetical protein E4U42_002419 [Claviceps africana]